MSRPEPITTDTVTPTTPVGNRLALVASIALAIVAILILPATPWWLAIDCDGTYVGSGLNLYAGKPTKFFGHPGIPLQTLVVITAAGDHAIRSLFVPMNRFEYVDTVLSDMGSVLWMIRGWAAVFFLTSVVCAHEVGRRWCGHWGWGILAAVLYMAAVGHLGRAIMLKPDNPVSALSLLITFLVIRGYQLRSVRLLLLATMTLGFAITVKVHAVGLIPLVGISLLLLRDRDWTGETLSGFRSTWRNHRRLIVLVVLAYVLLVVAMNSLRPHAEFEPRALIAMGFILVLLAVASWVWRCGRFGRTARFLFHPMWPMTITALVAGMVLPGLLIMDELIMTLRFMSYAVTGRGVNSGFEMTGFAAALWRQWRDPVMLMQLPFVLLAIVGVWRRARSGDRTVFLWLTAAGSMFLLAALRGVVLPSPHHYGPAIALCIPLVLAAFQSAKKPESSGAQECVRGTFFLNVPFAVRLSRPGVVPVALVIAISVCPLVTEVRASWWNRDRCDVLADVTRRLTPKLERDEYILTDYWAQNAESGYFMLVRDYCYYTPERDYRSLPDTPPALRYAKVLNMHPAFYITSGRQRTQIRTTPDDRMIARSVWGGEWYVRPLETHDLPNITIGVYAVEGPADDSDSGGPAFAKAGS